MGNNEKSRQCFWAVPSEQSGQRLLSALSLPEWLASSLEYLNFSGVVGIKITSNGEKSPKPDINYICVSAKNRAFFCAPLFLETHTMAASPNQMFCLQCLWAMLHFLEAGIGSTVKGDSWLVNQQRVGLHRFPHRGNGRDKPHNF